MQNHYSPESMDLDVHLTEEEIRDLRDGKLEAELMQHGQLLGRKLYLVYDDFDSLGTGIEVDYRYAVPDGAWDDVTAIEVRMNSYAYERLVELHFTGTRHGLGAQLFIFGPRGMDRF